MSDYSTILYDDSNAPVARITLNRPEKRNPIGPVTNGELIHALGRVRDDDAVRVVIVTGAGKVFCAGGDLGAMSGRSGEGDSEIQPASLVDLLTTMHAVGKPIIAMVNGHALAGGMGLMVACDLVIASDQAKMGTTEINLGLWPMMITAEITRNIGRKKTLELMLTGKRILAPEAEQLGLINRAVPAEDLEKETMALANILADRSPAAVRLGLHAFYQTQDMALEPALRHLEGQLGKILALEDAAEGIAAFFQKRKANWKGR